MQLFNDQNSDQICGITRVTFNSSICVYVATKSKLAQFIGPNVDVRYPFSHLFTNQDGIEGKFIFNQTAMKWNVRISNPPIYSCRKFTIPTFTLLIFAGLLVNLD